MEPGQALRAARVAELRTQADIASLLGVTQATISNWETGRTQVPLDQWIKLQRHLDLPDVDVVDDQSRVSTDGWTPNAAVGAFGTWLQQARRERGFTQVELARASGVSNAHISNLESGRSQNPRTQTRDRLTTALGVAEPEEIRSETEQLSAIPGLGSLEDFDPYADSDCPRLPGVYILYDVSDRPVYVGQSKNIRDRLRVEQAYFWFKRPIVELASFIEIADEQLRLQIEKILIRFLKSNAVINRQHVVR